MDAWCPERSEEDIGSWGTGVTDGCGPVCGCMELNPGLQKEQCVPLHTEKSLQALLISIFSTCEIRGVMVNTGNLTGSRSHNKTKPWIHLGGRVCIN